MPDRIVYLILGLCGVSFVISFLATAIVKRVAPRVGFVDKPGHRKIHTNPKPLGGGIAIFWAMTIPLIAGLIMIRIADPSSLDKTKVEQVQAYRRGAIEQTPLALSIIVTALA